MFGYNSSMFDGNCHVCKKPGHFAKECFFNGKRNLADTYPIKHIRNGYYPQNDPRNRNRSFYRDPSFSSSSRWMPPAKKSSFGYRSNISKKSEKKFFGAYETKSNKGSDMIKAWRRCKNGNSLMLRAFPNKDENGCPKKRTTRNGKEKIQCLAIIKEKQAGTILTNERKYTAFYDTAERKLRIPDLGWVASLNTGYFGPMPKKHHNSGCFADEQKAFGNPFLNTVFASTNEKAAPKIDNPFDNAKEGMGRDMDIKLD